MQLQYLYMIMKQRFHQGILHSSSIFQHSNLFLLYTLFLSLWSLPCKGVVQPTQNMTIPAVFAFGDSIVDQGNNNALKASIAKCNFPPYGKDFQGGIPTGRFSNGKTPPDLIAEELGVASLIPAYLDPCLKAQDLPNGVSFASGACGYDPETSKLTSIFSLSDQLEFYKEYIEKLKEATGEERTNFILGNGLHLVAAGSDDITNTYFGAGKNRRLHYDISSYTDFLVASASDFIKGLYNNGARRIVVLGLPPTGCLPSQRTLAGGPTRNCSEKYNQAARLLNSKLSRKLDSLTKSLAQSKVIYVDIYNPFLDLIQHPQNYGFEIIDIGCCGTGKLEVGVLCNKFSELCPDQSKYIFWDSFHPVERAYKILVNSILAQFINDLI